jgi:NTE family protein
LETKTASKHIARILGSALLCAALATLATLMMGCAHGHRAGSSTSPLTNSSQQQPVSGDVYGPTDDLKTEPAQNYGPAPIVTHAVVLVLGPGQAKALAEEGVIRALSDAKVPIAGIYGVEVGALVGALYAWDGSINQLEWQLMHYREEQFGVKESVLNRFLNSQPNDSDLKEALKKSFGEHAIEQSKIPMKILVQPQGQAVRVYEKGPLRKIVRAALGGTSDTDFEAVVLDDTKVISAAATKPFPIEDAKKFAEKSGAIVIAVDVLDPKTSDNFTELKNADIVIQPAVQAIGPKDYDKRSDAVFAGKSATMDKMDEIKRLVNPS